MKKKYYFTPNYHYTQNAAKAQRNSNNTVLE